VLVGGCVVGLIAVAVLGSRTTAPNPVAYAPPVNYPNWNQPPPFDPNLGVPKQATPPVDFPKMPDFGPGVGKAPDVPPPVFPKPQDNPPFAPGVPPLQTVAKMPELIAGAFTPGRTFLALGPNGQLRLDP